MASYQAWASTYDSRTIYDTSYLHAGPLFTHQLSHIWLDLRGGNAALLCASDLLLAGRVDTVVVSAHEGTARRGPGRGAAPHPHLAMGGQPRAGDVTEGDDAPPPPWPHRVHTGALMAAAAVSARPSPARRAKIPRSLRRPAWPKMLACLVCDKLRLAEGPGDRLHPKCRGAEE